MPNIVLDGWKKYKQNYPMGAAGLSVLPVTGQVTAGLDYAQAMKDGNTPAAIMAALGFIPGVKLSKYGSNLAPPDLRVLSQLNPVERAINPLVKEAPSIGNLNNANDVGEGLAQRQMNEQKLMSEYMERLKQRELQYKLKQYQGMDRYGQTG